MSNEPKSRQEIEQELLSAVEKAQRELQRACGADTGAATIKFRSALKRLNDFAVDGKVPEEKTE